MIAFLINRLTYLWGQTTYSVSNLLAFIRNCEIDKCFQNMQMFKLIIACFCQINFSIKHEFIPLCNITTTPEASISHS